ERRAVQHRGPGHLGRRLPGVAADQAGHRGQHLRCLRGGEAAGDQRVFPVQGDVGAVVDVLERAQFVTSPSVSVVGAARSGSWVQNAESGSAGRSTPVTLSTTGGATGESAAMGPRSTWDPGRSRNRDATAVVTATCRTITLRPACLAGVAARGNDPATIRMWRATALR